jgi:hypothetical protein
MGFLCPQSHTSKASDYIEKLHKLGSRTVDLCDGSDTAVDTLFLTNHLTLTWSPPDDSLSSNMRAKRLVITAVSRRKYRLMFQLTVSAA